MAKIDREFRRICRRQFMGGIRSGRVSTRLRASAEESIEIDIDEMRRDGVLTPGNLTLNLRGHGSSPCAPTIFPDGLVELPAR